ncbi:outer membrane beta-barrel protein [Methylobacterium sp. J-001]|uniref:outer membrane protein n=1 Tax=Methylobacterium sp. J-001 TaxID=2836609 RepID=UPI001FB89EAC|nr:outer membrane beta-barrel protein [Methylobacterium sp. J-001]MCJ2118229.1 outer membrane beta-barrel protein [Methylobacterium sp. J-001]
MRTVTLPLLAILGLCGVSTARAADLDYDYLRGADYDPVPAPVLDWSGVYVGGHGGYTSAALGFKNALQPLVYQRSHDSTAESDFRASTLLSPQSKRVGSGSFGVYAGYNFQYDSFVFGIEGDYTNFGRMGYSRDSIGLTRTNSSNLLENLYLSGTSATRINDYGTLRARVGYAVDNLMPYVTGGLAIGRARAADALVYSDSGFDVSAYNANQAGTKSFVNTFGSYHNDLQSKTKVVAGVALGAGLEYAITPNILLRAEYQYVLFNQFDGHKVNLNTVRAGAAVKF